MSQKSKVVLLCCGSFNPVTHQHLRMFELGRDHLHKTERYHVVSGLISPVHDSYKKQDLVSSAHRCEMIERAVTTSDWIHLSTYECQQEQWVRTRKSLEAHQAIVGNIASDHGVLHNPSSDGSNGHTETSNGVGEEAQNIEVMLLCGGDLLESFAQPGVWSQEDVKSIVRDHGMVVITREGSDPYKFIHDSDILQQYQNNIHIVTEWIRNEMSSTKIRRALRRGDSVKYLVPDDVIDYVRDQQLYMEVDSASPTPKVRTAAKRPRKPKDTTEDSSSQQSTEELEVEPELDMETNDNEAGTETTPIKKKQTKYYSKYCASWENDADIGPWVAPSEKGPAYAYCKNCDKDLRIHGGVTDLRKHNNVKKHILSTKQNAASFL